MGRSFQCRYIEEVADTNTTNTLQCILEGPSLNQIAVPLPPVGGGGLPLAEKIRVLALPLIIDHPKAALHVHDLSFPAESERQNHSVVSAFC